MTTDLDRLRRGDLSEEERSELFTELAASQKELCFNGLNCVTGHYGIAPVTGADLMALIRGDKKPDNLEELQSKSTPRSLPVAADNDPTRIDQTGWAVIFARDADPAIIEALDPLLALRRAQAGDLFRIFSGKTGYRTGESKSQFFARFRIGDGPAEPEQLGYYVLIVGSPEAIPFSFQYQLDVMRGVGRIFFDTTAEYESYARSVVAAESGSVRLPRRAVFFGTANPDDQATSLSAQYLVSAAYEKLRQRPTYTRWVYENDIKRGEKLDWSLDSVIGAGATKAKLTELLGGAQTPALLFTATHGAEFPCDDPRQLPHQGALVCQDWPGPRNFSGPVPQDFYFAGDDLKSSARLHGVIGFHFACFGGGTPKFEDFAQKAQHSQRQQLASQSFVARLPQRMLGHPGGGALAVISHVERAWAYSFLSPAGVEQTAVFQRTIAQLCSGAPVGWATESLNLRYADLAAQLAAVLENLTFDPQSKGAYELAALWTNHNDARGYAVFGDPAVRLPFTSEKQGTAQAPPPQVLTAVQTPLPDTAAPAANAAPGAQTATANAQAAAPGPPDTAS